MDKMTLSQHVTRLCECLEEAVSFAQRVSPGSGHNAGMWATAIREARAAIGGGESGATSPARGDWRPVIQALAAQVGNDWPEAALERLLWLTARYGYAGSWSEDLTERAEQEERLALHRWAREVIEAGIAFTQGPLEH